MYCVVVTVGCFVVVAPAITIATTAGGEAGSAGATSGGGRG